MADYMDLHPKDGRPMTANPAPKRLPDSEVQSLMVQAVASAEFAMAKFPQPNYVASKLGEEAGEVIGAFVKLSEGRGDHKDFHDETVQLIGLALRLYFEGDQTIERNAAKLA